MPATRRNFDVNDYQPADFEQEAPSRFKTYRLVKVEIGSGATPKIKLPMFRPWLYRPYKVAVGFWVGRTEDKLEPGTRVWFDGYTLRYVQGENAVVVRDSAVRGALREGWLERVSWPRVVWDFVVQFFS